QGPPRRRGRAEPRAPADGLPAHGPRAGLVRRGRRGRRGRGVTPRFVVGTGRCGSTLLSRMLSENREVLNVFELFSRIDQFFRFPRDPLDPSQPPPPPP